MSEENVEIVRRIFHAIDDSDWASVLATYDEDVEWDLSNSPFRNLLPKHIVRGHDGMRAFFRERQEVWKSIRDDCTELIDAGDRVISEVITHGRGRASEIEAEMKHYGVWTIRDGKVIRVEWFRQRSEALQALGPQE